MPYRMSAYGRNTNRLGSVAAVDESRPRRQVEGAAAPQPASSTYTASAPPTGANSRVIRRFVRLGGPHPGGLRVANEVQWVPSATSARSTPRRPHPPHRSCRPSASSISDEPAPTEEHLRPDAAVLRAGRGGDERERRGADGDSLDTSGETAARRGSRTYRSRILPERSCRASRRSALRLRPSGRAAPGWPLPSPCRCRPPAAKERHPPRTRVLRRPRSDRSSPAAHAGRGPRPARSCAAGEQAQGGRRDVDELAGDHVSVWRRDHYDAPADLDQFREIAERVNGLRPGWGGREGDHEDGSQQHGAPPSPEIPNGPLPRLGSRRDTSIGNARAGRGTARGGICIIAGPHGDGFRATIGVPRQQ